jgi:GT2 family glycosyltransferase
VSHAVFFTLTFAEDIQGGGIVNETDATIVVVPRDHFSDTRESLESVYKFTQPSCPLVYVDGGSPPRVARYLRKQAAAKHFELLRYDYYLTPNQARNIGAERVNSRYIVFIDNDVIVAPDWLRLLVDCAESTGAAVVGPLDYERRPLYQHVHFAGGDVKIISNPQGQRRNQLIDRIHKAPIPATPQPTDAAEFHCMLVRTEVFRKLGGLDEKMLSTRENIDFCLAVQNCGEKIYIDPRSKITYLPPNPLRMFDVPFFALRWSDQWDLSSFHYLRDKWNLDEDEYFLRQYKHLGWRRHELMMRAGLLRWLVSWRLRGAVERMLRPVEQRVNSAIARRHAERHGVPIRIR